MNKIVLLVLMLGLLFLSSCMPHSLGKKNVSADAQGRTVQIPSGKNLFLVFKDGTGGKLDDSPAFIITQFSKFVAPVASAVGAEPSFTGNDAALELAKERAADYLFIVEAKQWQKSSLTSPGFGIEMDVTIFDAASGEELTRNTISAHCYVMAMGLEMTARECVRPQIDEWRNSVFAQKGVTTPYADPQSFR